MPVAERRQETEALKLAPPLAAWDNWPDTGDARARKGADVGQVSMWRTLWKRRSNRRTCWMPTWQWWLTPLVLGGERT
jgi:hypothetical protein